MRKVLIAIAVLIVLVWLIPWDLEPDGQMSSSARRACHSYTRKPLDTGHG